MLNFLLLLILLSNSSHAFEPRGVFQCGKMAVIESKIGEFQLLQNIGNFSGPSEPLQVVLEAQKIDDECAISVSSPKVKFEPVRYYFNGQGDPLKGRVSLVAIGPGKINFDGVPDCQISKRYQETLGKCRIPAAEDTRDNCYDLPGRPLEVELREATFSSWETLDKNNRYDLFSGGIQIKTYVSKENESENFQSRYFNFWYQNNEWCLHDSETFSDQRGDCSKKFQGNFELRNKNGEIIGLVQKDGNDLILVQVKKPLSKKGSIVDLSKEFLKITLGDKVTTMSAYTKEGGSVKDGMAKIYGGFEKSGIEFTDLPPFGIGMTESKIADCNYRNIIKPSDYKKLNSSSIIEK